MSARSSGSRLAAIAVIEAGWFSGILTVHTLTGSSIAPKLLLSLGGLLAGWAVAYLVLSSRPQLASFGPERRIRSSTFLVLLYAMYALVPTVGALFLMAFSPALSFVGPGFPYLVGGALAGLYFALFARLLAARPRFEDEPVPGERQREESGRRSERIAWTLLLAGGTLLALYTLMFGVYALIEHVVTPLVQYLAI